MFDSAIRGSDSWLHGSTAHFLRHYVEMVLAMYIGMIGLGAVFGLILYTAGTTAQDARYDLPVLFAVVMCFNMTVGMAVWMRHRRHDWDRVWEMVGAMAFPAIVALGLFWSGAIGAGPVCPIECMGSLFTMLAAMLLRAGEYSRPVHAVA